MSPLAQRYRIRAEYAMHKIRGLHGADRPGAVQALGQYLATTMAIEERRRRTPPSEVDSAVRELIDHCIPTGGQDNGSSQEEAG